MTRQPRFPPRALLAWLAALALALGSVGGARAQVEGPEVAITGVNSDDFPTVTADLAVTGANGLPLAGLTAADFTVLEDGRPVPPSNVVVTGAASQPLTLVLAVDLAMPGEELIVVQAALRAFTDSLTPQDQVALLAFADEVVEVQSFTNNPVDLATAIGGLTPSGSATVFNQAAETAIGLLAAAPATRRAVLMFTDSGDTANTLSPESTINNAQAAGVALYPFGFGPKVNETIVNNWARFTGGQAYLLATPGEIQSNVRNLAALMRQSYQLTYTSGVTADNARHELVVELNLQGQTASGASRFTAVPGEVTIEGLTIANGQTLRGMVFLIAEVTAPAPVESVAFRLDGETLVELTSPPYRFDWDTATAGAGTHAVTVLARDRAGNVGELQVSVNVAVPPPVAPTAAPIPTPVPSESPVLGLARSAFNVAGIVLAAGALLLGFIIALLLWLRSRELMAPLPVTGCRLELVNRGNARTRFELRAEDPAKLMKFQFLVNDASLATRQAPATYASAAATQVAPAAGLAAPVPANGKKNGKAKKDQGGGPRRVQVPGAMKKAQSTAFAGVGIAARISSWVMAITYLLPGNASLKMRGQTARFRSDIDVVDDAAKAPDRYRNIVDDVVDVPIIGDKAGGAMPRPPKGKAAASPPVATMTPAPAAAGVTMVAGAPTVMAAAPAQPALKSMAANSAGWAVTPYVEPGGMLTVRLHIQPLRVPKTQAYSFRVMSRSADSDERSKLTQIEHGSVALTSLPWYRQVVPWLLFTLSAGLLALLVWYLLRTFGVIG